MAEAKKRKVTKSDWDKVETHIKDVFQSRKTSKFRKNHERIWKEVDRQVSMTPMERLTADGKKAPQSWHAALELGELAKASEIITADVMRITFPQDKYFFLPHVELKWPLDPKTGLPQANETRQGVEDGLLRSLMVQQQKDFGFKARFRLSVKEALHHGSFVAEVRFEEQMMVREGDKVRKIGAPVWVPYSMWNSYPDPSPSVIGTNMFYTGSMILVEYMPIHTLKAMKGDGWIPDRLKLVQKRGNKNNDNDTEDVELVKFKGDIVIERGDGDIFLPNSEVILANDKLVFYHEAELPYPNVIFAGYERQDVRDPYYTSPIIKQSPTQRIGTISANKFIDATSLKVEPPVEYDGNDPDYVMNDGPVLSPGAKTPTRSMGKGFTALDIGDPRFALDAYTLTIRQMQEGLGVSALRAGVRESDRETATSANLANQGAEVRTMEFISELEPQALVPFLYMQHELNRMKMGEYTFYNDEMHTPDFMRVSKKDIQENAHFEVVGSRGVLGEEKRERKFAETTAFLSGNPLFAPKLKVTDIMLKMYRDSGEKSPESLVMTDDGKPQIPPQVQQAMQQLQQQNQQLTQMVQQLKSGHDIKAGELQLKAKKLEVDSANETKQTQIDAAAQLDQQQHDQKELAAQIANDRAQLALDREQINLDRQQMRNDFVVEMAKIRAQLKISEESNPGEQSESSSAESSEPA
jgi:hypothetical protein